MGTRNDFSYSDACAFLDRLTDFERADGYRYDDKNFNLDRTRGLLAAVGNPQSDLRGVLVAGTKGKGSTAAMLASILDAAGLKTGLYTSPHLQEYRERIRIGLAPIAGEEFGRLAGLLAEPVSRHAARGRPTTFEVLTAMALLGFARARAEVVVLEVGMGGRLDATNVFEAQAVCITPVSFDHMDQLGNTIEAIASEKAGIIKSASPVVIAPQLPEAMSVIEGACRAAGARMIRAGFELEAGNVRLSESGTAFDARLLGREVGGMELTMLGRHQVDNALAAAGTALALSPGIRVGDEDIKSGLKRAFWPGRLQRLTSDPRLLLDGAHNPDSARALTAAMRDIFPGRPVTLLLGHLRGKDPGGFASVICPLARRVVAAELAHPRAMPASEVAKAARLYAGQVEVAGNVREALKIARAGGEPGEIILITGSLALVGQVLREEKAAVN